MKCDLLGLVPALCLVFAQAGCTRDKAPTVTPRPSPSGSASPGETPCSIIDFATIELYLTQVLTNSGEVILRSTLSLMFADSTKKAPRQSRGAF